MAWNPTPEVAAARDLARKVGANVGCVVIYLKASPDQLGMISYGVNQALCDEMGKLGLHLQKAAMDFYADGAGEGG